MPREIKNDRPSNSQIADVVRPIVKQEIRRRDGALADKIAVPSGLEFDADGKLKIDIGQSPSVLAINTTGLVTQYITVGGGGANVDVTIRATGTGIAALQSDNAGSARLDCMGGGAFCAVNNDSAAFGAGSTTYSISATLGLLGVIDASIGAYFRIEDSSFNFPGIHIDAVECALTGFYANFADGTPVRVQPQESISTPPTVSVIGATGNSVQGGLALIEGGKTYNVGANTASGPVCIRGGIPEGTGNSQVKIEVQDSTPNQYTVIECGIDATPAGTLGFYGTAPIAKQLGVPVTAAGIHAALVALGLIT